MRTGARHADGRARAVELSDTVRHVLEGTGAATMPQPSTLRLILNVAALAAESESDFALQILVECSALETKRVRLVALR